MSAPQIVTGNDGAVWIDGTATPVATLNKWSLSRNTAVVEYATFSSPTDSDGKVYKQTLTGLSGGKVTCEGYFDTNPSTATDSGSPGLRDGLEVTMSLLLVAGEPFGFGELIVQIESIETGQDIEANKPAPFKLTGTVNGVVPNTGTVTG